MSHDQQQRVQALKQTRNVSDSGGNKQRVRLLKQQAKNGNSGDTATTQGCSQLFRPCSCNYGDHRMSNVFIICLKYLNTRSWFCLPACFAYHTLTTLSPLLQGSILNQTKETLFDTKMLLLRCSCWTKRAKIGALVLHSNGDDGNHWNKKEQVQALKQARNASSSSGDREPPGQIWMLTLNNSNDRKNTPALQRSWSVNEPRMKLSPSAQASK